MRFNSELLKACDTLAADFHSGTENTMAELVYHVLRIGRQQDGAHDDTMQALYSRNRKLPREDWQAAFKHVRELLMAPINGTEEPAEAEKAATP